jgi:MFS family permease
VSSSMPRAFTRLWSASALTNLTDGALLAAGPLLLASITTDPVAVAAALVVQQLPWLLFALVSGAIVDRVPRLRLVVAVNAVRAAAVGFLALSITLDQPRLWLLYAVLFLLGTAETLGDSAYGALVANTVPPDLLGRANARLFLTFSIGNQLLGPPLGAVLFAAGAALPLGSHALTTALAALILLRIKQTPESTMDSKGTLRGDIGEGLRWLWRHEGLRLLCACILVMNLAGGGVFALWVLYAQQHLGLTDAQYGLFVMVGAVGTITGSWVYGRLERAFGRGVLLRVGLVVETLTYAALAMTSSPWVAGLVMAVFGVHAIVWGSVAVTVRQLATPSELYGRVGSGYALASVSGTATGALAGGVLADRLGLLAVFWVAFALVGVMTVLTWRRLPAI